MAVSARDEESRGGSAYTSVQYSGAPNYAPGGRGRHARPKKQANGFWRGLREVGIIVVSALVLSALVRAFLIQAFYVPSASMEDTLLISDRIIASKVSTTIAGVSRGEVVVFRDPGDWLPPPPPRELGFRGQLRAVMTFVGLLPSDSGEDLVKRVIAVGGDRIACCDAQGRIVLNGVPLNEAYIIGPTDQVRFDVVVPPDSIFVMGDNRGNSRDSRFHLTVNDGSVPVDNIVGRVVLVLWPFDHFATMPIPSIFQDPAISAGR